MTPEERDRLRALIDAHQRECAGAAADGLVHGTETTYRAHGCRCDDCRTVASKARRARAARLVERGGTYTHDRTGYTTYGCRCPICRAANTAYSRADRARKKAA